MGYIIGSTDGPGYVAPSPQDYCSCIYSYCICPIRVDPASVDIELRGTGGPMINRSNTTSPAKPLLDVEEGGRDWAVDVDGTYRPRFSVQPVAEHPDTAQLELLADFLAVNFPDEYEVGEINDLSIADVAIGTLRQLIHAGGNTTSINPLDYSADDAGAQEYYEATKSHYSAALDPRTVQPGETRSVDPRTGAEKGTKLARFDLIPQGPLLQLAEHFGLGALKYDDHQWRAGYDWSKSYAALQRHLGAFWSGEDLDPDPSMEGASHLAAAAWHVFALMEFYQTFPEGDDRWKTNTEEAS